MQVRKENNKKWTSFPRDYEKTIEKIVKEHFKEQLNNLNVIVETRIYPEELILSIGLKKKNLLRQHNFESSIDYDANKEKALEKMALMFDSIIDMMEQFFQYQEEINFPHSWEDFKINNNKNIVYLKYSTENNELEQQADYILYGNKYDSLVKEAKET